MQNNLENFMTGVCDQLASFVSPGTAIDFELTATFKYNETSSEREVSLDKSDNSYMQKIKFTMPMPIKQSCKAL